MVENMIYWRDQAEEFGKLQDPQSQSYARLFRMNAQKAATELAPYCHPKLAALAIAGDPDAPVTIEHRHSKILALTDEQAEALLAKFDCGELSAADLTREILGQ